MNDSDSFSRRQWLERVSGPALIASLGAGALVANLAAAQAGAAPDDKQRGARVFNIRDFGAKGDGQSLDTTAVQAAIDACNREDGGTVLVPAGDFVVGTLELRSNVTIHLAAKGRLLGSPQPADFRAGTGIPPGNGNVVLLGGADLENIAIEGSGTIDGNGLKFWTGQGDNTGPGGNSAEGYFQRPHLIVLARCRNVRIRDVFLTASAYHCTRILNCERIWIDGVRIYNRVNKNNDGFHFNSCRYVHVSNCDIKCQDDACALFGSNQWVTVTNCTFSTRWSIFRFGAGESENITVSNCVIYDTFGSVVKMAGRAGSRYENITFSNLIMKNVTGPITVGLHSRRNANATTPLVRGIIRNIAFNGIRAQVAAEGQQFPDLHWEQSYRDGERRTCITVNGVEDDIIENVSFTDVHVIYEGGGTAEEAAIRDVPKIAGEYFEMGARPAHGLFARNVRGLTLHNVRFEVKKPDLRPALVFDHVSEAALNGLVVQGNEKAESVLRLTATRDTLITGARVLTPAPVFLRLEGPDNAGIVVDGGDLQKTRQPLAFAAGATDRAVTLRG